MSSPRVERDLRLNGAPSSMIKVEKQAGNPFEQVPASENFPPFLQAIKETSSESNLSLNLSIGAQAALTEHLRQVGKFGIDHDFVAPPNRTNYDEPEGAFCNKLDVEWDRLLDSTLSQVSNASTMLCNALSVNSDQEDVEDGKNCLLDAQSPASFPFSEVSGDNDGRSGSSFFDSSRAWTLQTPERVRNNIMAIGVTLRSDKNDLLESDLLSTPQKSPPLCWIPCTSPPHQLSPSSIPAESAVSFLGVDLSHISESGGSPLDLSRYRLIDGKCSNHSCINGNANCQPDFSPCTSFHHASSTTPPLTVFPGEDLGEGPTLPLPLAAFQSEVSPQHGCPGSLRMCRLNIVTPERLPETTAVSTPSTSRNPSHNISPVLWARIPASVQRSHRDDSIRPDDSASGFLNSSCVPTSSLSEINQRRFRRAAPVRVFSDEESNSHEDSKSGFPNANYVPTSSLSHRQRRQFRSVVPVRVFLDSTESFVPEYDSFSAPFPGPHHSYARMFSQATSHSQTSSGGDTI